MTASGLGGHGLVEEIVNLRVEIPPIALPLEVVPSQPNEALLDLLSTRLVVGELALGIVTPWGVYKRDPNVAKEVDSFDSC